MKNLTNERVTKQLHLHYSEHHTGGEICEGQENESWPSHEDENITVTFKALYRNRLKDDWYCDPIDVTDEVYDSDIAHMAVIRYFDGGTFGRTCGYWHVVGLYKTHTEAIEAIEEAKSATGYKPWEGYFSGLEDTETYILNIFDK